MPQHFKTIQRSLLSSHPASLSHSVYPLSLSRNFSGIAIRPHEMPKAQLMLTMPAVLPPLSLTLSLTHTLWWQQNPSAYPLSGSLTICSCGRFQCTLDSRRERDDRSKQTYTYKYIYIYNNPYLKTDFNYPRFPCSQFVFVSASVCE